MTVQPFARKANAAIGVAVVTFNSMLDIQACLESLRTSEVGRIVVLDNCSSPEQSTRTEEICSKFSDVDFVRSDVNLGFGAGANLAVSVLKTSMASLEYVWVVNPDTVADSLCATGLRAAVSSGRFDIVSPQVTTGPSNSQPVVWFNGGALDLESVRTVHLGIGQPAEDGSDESSCSFLTGAAVFMSLRTWETLGGFSEEYFLYWEDADLSYRAMSLGFRLGVVSGSRVWHSVGGSGDRTGKSATYYYFMQRNRALFARRIQLGRRLFWGSGLVESLRLTLRPLKQQANPFTKFLSGLRGLIAGIRPIPSISGGRTLTATDPKPVFITWTRENGRSSDLAAALGADLVHIYPSGRILERYVKSFVESRKLLASLQADQLAFLMLPPTPLAVAARLARGKNHIRNVYDLHTGFFYDPKWQWASRLTLRLMRGAKVIVTNDNLARICSEVGVDAYVLHDILESLDGTDLNSRSGIVCPVSYSNDEPISEILATARSMPNTRWILTGNAPDAIRENASENVHFTGFVSNAEYDSLLKEALLVVALTNRRDTMQRAGYEAIMRSVPVVTSDFEVLREFFEDAAVYVQEDGVDLGEKVEKALKDRELMVDSCRNILAKRMSEQQDGLRLISAGFGDN